MSYESDRARWKGVRLFPETVWRAVARESGIRKAALMQAAERSEREGARMHVYANGTIHYVRPASDPQPIPSVLIWIVEPDGSLTGHEPAPTPSPAPEGAR